MIEIDNWAMSQKVVDWMTENIRKDCRVLELGGGTGSHRLHEHFEDVITVEHDREWARKLQRQGLPILYAPLEQKYYRDEPRLWSLVTSADVIVVDGPPGNMRVGFMRFLRMVKDGCLLVIDDSQRESMRRLLKHPTIAIITDENRTTHICRADNPNNPKTKKLDKQKPVKRPNKKAVPDSEMETVSKEISGGKSSVQSVRKTGKRSGPHSAGKRSS